MQLISLCVIALTVNIIGDEEEEEYIDNFITYYMVMI